MGGRMSLLFEPIEIGTLGLRNRLMRSATAERAADALTGAPSPRMAEMYRALAEGGIGLIVTGHACVEMGGRAHWRMAAIGDDALIPAWRETVGPAQAAGARVMMQINHAGASAQPGLHAEVLTPSGIPTGEAGPAHAMNVSEIERLVAGYGAAARRAREAGLDGVQIHGAHGYLVSQFLSPLTNRRDDEWGGDVERRQAFLRAVIAEIRRQVGTDYPLWIKLGLADQEEGGLAVTEGAAAARTCAEMGVNCIEISHGLGVPDGLARAQEGQFLPLAQAARRAVPEGFPLALVRGFITRQQMEATLEAGVVQIVSLCRPLVAEPDLAARLASGAQERAACSHCDRCWPEDPDDWVRCRNRATLAQIAAR